MTFKRRFENNKIIINKRKNSQNFIQKWFQNYWTTWGSIFTAKYISQRTSIYIIKQNVSANYCNNLILANGSLMGFYISSSSALEDIALKITVLIGLITIRLEPLFGIMSWFSVFSILYCDISIAVSSIETIHVSGSREHTFKAHIFEAQKRLWTNYQSVDFE